MIRSRPGQSGPPVHPGAPALTRPEIASRDLDNVFALYQNERLEATMERLRPRPEPRFLETIRPAAAPPPAKPSPPRSGGKQTGG